MSWEPKSKEVVIVANGESPSKAFLTQFKGKTLLALDGGLKVCHEYGLFPDLILGDFDSAPESLLSHYRDVPQLTLMDQNKTDLEKALEFLESFSLASIVVCGATGLRVDQTLTNICLLCRYPGKVKFESEIETCFASFQQITFPCFPNQLISLIPISVVTHLNTQGLKWELKDATLDKNFFSLSNRCLSSSFSLSYQTGDLIVSLHR